MFPSLAAGLLLAVALAGTSAGTEPVAAQSRRRPAARKPKPMPVQPPRLEPANVTCAESLGTGVRTGAQYCFVLAGMNPAQGVLVSIPPHTGDATLRFNLHNRHTYSEEEMRAGRGYAKYTAVIGVLTLKGELLDRAAVQAEFRSPKDLFERISGGAGPGGVKAVAPVGMEPIAIVIPAGIDQVSLLGEVLDATTPAGRETQAPGRPVAIVSSMTIEYKPKAATRGR